MKKPHINATIIALIGILSVLLLIPWVAEANPVPYNQSPVTEFPILTVQTPETSSPIYANNTLELNFNVTKPQPWTVYYHGNVPTLGTFVVYLYLDGVMKQMYAWTYDTVDQRTAVFENLTQQQHTIWIDIYCRVVGAPDAPFNASVSQTLTFTIDAQAQTIAFHEDPVVTTRPGVMSTIAPSPPPPTSTPTPTVPELSWFTIVPLLLSFLYVAVLVRYRKIAKG